MSLFRKKSLTAMLANAEDSTNGLQRTLGAGNLIALGIGAIIGAGLGSTCALITDGRFSGGSHGFVVGHVTPEAYDGGGIALVKDGDLIAIDAVKNTIDLKISDEEFAARKAAWRGPETHV